MTYIVTVDISIPTGTPEMDPLQRAGAVALLEDGFDSVEGIAGPEGLEVDVLDSIVAVYPGGALLKVCVDASALEFAEGAVRAVVGELLERSELLVDWSVDRCEVELHPEGARESLAAADGPDVPPADPEVRKARHNERPKVGEDGEEYDAEAKAAEVRARMLALATELRSFPPSMFGALGEDGTELEDADYDSAVSPVDAALAAGALVYSTDILVDELFEDVQALAEDDTTVAECKGHLWHLEDLPERYALQYGTLFARRFLVTVIAMTTRCTNGSFQQLGCVAEELALKLLLNAATVSLDTFGLLDDGVKAALDTFAENVYEDMDFEWLYDDSMDGIDESPVGEALRIAPMSIGSWFTPFNEGRFVHPYAADESGDAER
ncbi:hypothetical protein ACFU99_08905 [Streptomyces sp. NPDC057654]|uniref:hypothetical protein n=1 Tax=Streptomyces sp. NPDC057654 TaxID=3346196 RepID=UPI0036866C51